MVSSEELAKCIQRLDALRAKAEALSTEQYKTKNRVKRKEFEVKADRAWHRYYVFQRNLPPID